jgi:hypothetical protein
MYASRIGRFRVAALFFVNMAPLQGVNVFKDMIVLDVTHDWATHDRWYTAVHPHFRPKAEGEIIPEYQAVFSPGSVYPFWMEVREPQQAPRLA